MSGQRALNKIVIASKNIGKISEIRNILMLENVEFLDLRALDFEENIEESGRTFRENALIKAEAVFGRYGIPVVADDSGLSVGALGGRPGVMSARFSGLRATDKTNNELLLEMLRGVPHKARRASFFCAAVFYHCRGEYLYAEGRVDGFIAMEPAGRNGFGYDPLFYLPDFGKTMAQLPREVKNTISHRSKAFRELGALIRAHGSSIFPGLRP
jgi:XTP/dITP diphosphohydrolase